MTNLDVSIRAKFVNQMKAGAKAAASDLKSVSDAARKLGATGAGGKLTGDLARIDGSARTVRNDLAGVAGAARALGATRVSGQFLAPIQAQAHAAKFDIIAIKAEAAKIGATRGPAKLAGDLVRVDGAARTVRNDLASAAGAARRLGTTGVGDKLAGDLRKVSTAARSTNAELQKLNHTSHALGGRGGRGGTRAAALGAVSGEVASGIGMPGAALGLLATAGGGPVGIAAVIIGIITGRALKESIGEAMKFEDAMAEVKKAVDLSPQGLAEMERTILRISRETPLAKEDVAQLVAQAGFAGRPTGDLVRFATFAAKAAVAFGMTADEAGDSLAKLGNVFELTQQGIEDLGDAINSLGDSTASKERQIVEFLTRVGPAAKGFGLAEREAAAFGAAIISLGTSEEVASTGFTAFITKLGTAEKGGKKFQLGLKSLGLNAKQVTKMIKAGPVDAIMEVLRRIDQLPAEKKAGVMVDMFGLEYQDDVARMAGAIPNILKALDQVKNKAQTAGSVDKAFTIFDELTSAKLKKLQHQFEVLGVRIGRALTPALGAAADAIAAFLEKVNGFFDRLAVARELADKTASGQPLTAEDREKLKADPKLEHQYQREVAKGEHPVIGLIQQQIALEKELAEVQAAAARGDIGAQNKMIAVQAALSQINIEIEQAARLPGAAEAVSRSMRGVADAISTEGVQAVQAAEEIARRIQALFNFNVSPSISPQFALPSGDPGKMPSAPLPPRKPGSLARDGRRAEAAPVIHQHIHGADPHRVAQLARREQERALRTARAGALHDLGSWS